MPATSTADNITGLTCLQDKDALHTADVTQTRCSLSRLPSGTGRNVPGVLSSSESLKPALFFMTLWFHLVHDKKRDPRQIINTTLRDTMPKQLLYNTPDRIWALSLPNRANSYFGEQRDVCWFNFFFLFWWLRSDLAFVTLCDRMLSLFSYTVNPPPKNVLFLCSHPRKRLAWAKLTCTWPTFVPVFTEVGDSDVQKYKHKSRSLSNLQTLLLRMRQFPGYLG